MKGKTKKGYNKGKKDKGSKHQTDCGSECGTMSYTSNAPMKPQMEKPKY